MHKAGNATALKEIMKTTINLKTEKNQHKSIIIVSIKRRGT